MNFGDELEKYVVLKLHLKDSKIITRTIDSDFKIVGFETRDKIRKDEKKLLKMYFRNWKAPYNSNLKGWRKESPIYILYRGELVSGLYICSQNEFDEDGWGQLHYFITDPAFKGKGLHSVLIREAMKKGELWGLQGFIINTDRNGLPEVYLKWGATPWKEINKLESSMPMSKRNKITHLFKMF